MFRHRGKSRTFIHNLKLASLLSFVAGMVNVTGLSAIQKLTTNVTGHFAYFADEMAKKNFAVSVVYLLYILAFFFGAFCSGLLVEMMFKKNARFLNTIPVGIETVILVIISFLDPKVTISNSSIVACALLFAMGLQNALVTSLSNAIVRTTHLTGLFTDLGIEVSQLFFYKEMGQQKKLRSSIRLRLTIISFFFLGGIIGGFGYFLYGIKVLLVASSTLLAAIIYDSLKFRIVTLKRKYMR